MVRTTRPLALGVDKKLQIFDFVVLLLLTKDIFVQIKRHAKQKNVSIVDGATLIDTTIRIVDEIKSDTGVNG